MSKSKLHHGDDKLPQVYQVVDSDHSDDDDSNHDDTEIVDEEEAEDFGDIMIGLSGRKHRRDYFDNSDGDDDDDDDDMFDFDDDEDEFFNYANYGGDIYDGNGWGYGLEIRGSSHSSSSQRRKIPKVKVDHEVFNVIEEEDLEKLKKMLPTLTLNDYGKVTIKITIKYFTIQMMVHFISVVYVLA